MWFPVTLSPWSPGWHCLLPVSMCDNAPGGSPNREARLRLWSPESVVELVGGWGAHGAWPQVAAQSLTISPGLTRSGLSQRRGCYSTGGEARS